MIPMFALLQLAQASSPVRPSALVLGPTSFAWADVDGDGLLELATLSGNGDLRLMREAGDGRFEDATKSAGLEGVDRAGLLLWQDYDGDGRLDLFVGARSGPSRLFHNEGGGFFLDWTAASGLSIEGEVLSAQWFDHDGDGRLDLQVVTKDAAPLFRGLEGGFLETVALPVAVAGENGSPENGVRSNGATTRGTRDSSLHGSPARTVGSSTSITVTPGAGPAGMTQSFSSGCLPKIRDQATGGCLSASSIPVLGKLYPISQSWFVSPSGNVGLGTTSPIRSLHVFGGADGLAMMEQMTPGQNAVLELKDSTVAQASLSAINFVAGDGGTYGQVGYAKSTGLMNFETGATTKMWLNDQGQLGIGRLPTTNLLEVEGDASKVAAGSWLANSDRRIKTDVREIHGALATLDRLRPVEFRYTDEYVKRHPAIENKEYFNVIAQEFAEVFPDYVKDSGEDGILQVDTYPALIHAIAAVKELHGIVEQKDQELRALVAEKNEQIAALQERMSEELSQKVARLDAVEARLQRIEGTLAAVTGSK